MTYKIKIKNLLKQQSYYITINSDCNEELLIVMIKDSIQDHNWQVKDCEWNIEYRDNSKTIIENDDE